LLPQPHLSASHLENQLPAPALQNFVDGILDLMIFDGEQLSDLIVCAEAAYIHWTQDLKLTSVGVLAVTEAECSGKNLPAFTDGIEFPVHATIDFTG
jgi:hypothetical protein